jgi:hypothetical protein
MQYTDLSDKSLGHLKILLYGAPGVGKTRFIASTAEVLQTLILDVDDGSKTIRYMSQSVKDNVTVLRMTTFADLDVLYKLAVKNDPALWTAHIKRCGGSKVISQPFQALAIDTMSEMQFEMIEEIRPGDSKAGMADMKKLQALQIQEWGKVIDLVRVAIRAFRDIPITFIASFHEMLMKDELSGHIFGVPSLKGKDLPSEIGKYFDITGHMTMTQDGKYALATKGHAKWQAKSRIPCDAILLNPSYNSLVNSLQKSI